MGGRTAARRGSSTGGGGRSGGGGSRRRAVAVRESCAVGVAKTLSVVPPRPLEFVLLLLPLPLHRLLVLAPHHLPFPVRLFPLLANLLIDLCPLLLCCDPRALLLLLVIAIERKSLDMVRLDPERLAEPFVGLAFCFRKFVTFVTLDGTLTLTGVLLGRELVTEGRDLRLDLFGGEEALVLELVLEYKALRFDATLTLVFEDGLVGSAVGEGFREVGGFVVRTGELTEAARGEGRGV